MHGETLGDIFVAALKDHGDRTIRFDSHHGNTIHAWANIPKHPERKINMIKEIRSLTGMGLKDAKDVVESKDGFVLPSGIFDALVRASSNSGWWVTNDPYTKTYNPYRIFC